MNSIKSIYQRIKPYVIFTLTALFLFFEMALQVSGSVITKPLIFDFHLTATTVALVLSFYYYSYTIMQIPAGLLFDYFSAKRLIMFNLFLCVLATLMFSIAKTALVIAFSRLIMGFGSAFAFVAVLYVAIQWFPNRYFAILSGITMLLAATGAMGGQLPIALMVDSLGWRSTLQILAIGGFILTFMMYFLLEDKPTSSHSTNQPQLPQTKQTVTTQLSYRQKLILLAKIPQVWVIASYAFLIWAPITAFASLWGVPFIAKAYHISNAKAASACSIIWLGIAISSPMVGWYSDHFKQRKLPLITVSLIGLIASIIIIYVKIPFPLVYITLFFFGTGAAGQSLSFAVLCDNVPKIVTATAIGLNNGAVVASGFIFQPLIGWLLTCSHRRTTAIITHPPNYSIANYQDALVIIVIIFAMSLAVALFLIPESYGKQLGDKSP